MIWLSRILTVLEIFFLFKAIAKARREQECQQDSSTETDASQDVSTPETTAPPSNTN